MLRSPSDRISASGDENRGFRTRLNQRFPLLRVSGLLNPLLSKRPPADVIWVFGQWGVGSGVVVCPQLRMAKSAPKQLSCNYQTRS
ncbi:hypothetical protein AVEN_42801-1 [Araneus ventricosus]|uniref:Uncharacterized protein n=1 Tax=Araneus ventricosus TaxID=182803 RepID=A0A4Y2AEU2_ARAVE|nr:hypothetical protein AVEN_42801-1 [Araneus ventricosus]